MVGPASSQREGDGEAVTFPPVEGLQKLWRAWQSWQQAGLGGDPTGDIFCEPSLVVTKGQRSAGMPHGWRGRESIGGKYIWLWAGQIHWSNPGRRRAWLSCRQTRKLHACCLQPSTAGLQPPVLTPRVGKWAGQWEENWPDHPFAVLPRGCINPAAKAQQPGSGGGTRLVSPNGPLSPNPRRYFSSRRRSLSRALPHPCQSRLGFGSKMGCSRSSPCIAGSGEDFVGEAVPKKTQEKPQTNPLLQINYKLNLFPLQKD